LSLEGAMNLILVPFCLPRYVLTSYIIWAKTVNLSKDWIWYVHII